MTKPKFPIPAETVHHTRYTLEGLCFCAPRPGLRTTAGYLFALACLRHGQMPHAEVLMPAERSGVLTDREACRSDFFRDYHVWLAVQWGKTLGRHDGIWNKQAPGDRPCLDTGDVEDAMLTTWELPLERDLVERVEDYPGFKIMPDDWGQPMVFRRPPGAPAQWPPTVVIVPQPPRQYRDWPLDEVKAYFNAKIRQRELYHRERRRTEGKNALGRGKCLSLPTHVRVDLPRESARGWRARDTALLDVIQTQFDDKHARYEEGRLGLQFGRTDHVFPAGTFKLARQFDIDVDPVPAQPLTVIHDVVPRARAPG